MNDQSKTENEFDTALLPIKLSDIIDIADIQRYQDSFAHSHNVASIITNTDGSPITEPTNFTRLCKNIIRETEKGCENCFRSDAFIGRFNPTGPIVQPCLSSGIWDAGVSISVGGKHIANWLIGQVRNEKVDEFKILEYATEIGADPAAFKSAFEEVPVMSEEQFNKVANFLFFYANELSEKAYRNKQLNDLIKLNNDDKIRLNNLLDNLETGIVVHASDTSVIQSNLKACEILGLCEDEMKGKKSIDPIWKFIGTDLEPILVEKYPVNHISTTKKPFKDTIFGIQHTKDNSIVWVNVNGFPVIDTHNCITEIVISFIDITEKKLLENELKYRALFETSNDANLLIFDGRFVDCNEEALDLFGCDRDQIIGSEPIKFSPLIQPNGHLSSEEAQKKINKALSGESQHFEWEHCRLDGTTFAAEITLHPINIGRKTHLQVIVRNVSENKRSEQTISMLAHAIRSISECVSITDMEDTIIFVNKAFIKTYKYDEQELIGNNISIIRSPNNSLETVEKILPTTIEGGWSGELLNVKKDGTEFPVFVSTSVIRDEKGDPVALIGITKDITASKQAELLLKEKSEKIIAQNEQLNKTNIELIFAKDKAEESDRLKSAFLANMSHEIRTPMNGILGFSDLLKQPGLSGDEQQAYIEIIEKSGARLLNIINDIIDISKIEAGLMKLNLKESNINEQTNYIFNFFKPELDAKNINFSLQNGLSDKEAKIITDCEKVYAILTNLVKNAIKYTEKGALEFGYSFNSEQKLSYLTFYVKDSGIGIPKKRQHAVFERFIQADIADKMARQGAGLGLTISKAYVEMLGGKIWLESTEGIGSTFYFTLPFNIES